MSSPAQIAANQRNAELSTGPKTSAGKAVSSKNAQKHDLLGLDVILPDEDLNAFRELAQGLEGELNPQGDLEYALMERIVALMWRLRRAERLESAVLSYQQSRVKMVRPPEEEGEPLNESEFTKYVNKKLVRGVAYIAGENSLEKLSRYETSIQRNLLRMMHELQRLQAARKGEHVLAPQAIDIDVIGLPESTGVDEQLSRRE